MVPDTGLILQHGKYNLTFVKNTFCWRGITSIFAPKISWVHSLAVGSPGGGGDYGDGDDGDGDHDLDDGGGGCHVKLWWMW